MPKYEDILHLPHPDPKKHQRMTLENRAAQFSPFAALTGHNEAIKETERLTDRKIELEEDAITDINRTLIWIMDNIESHPEVVVTYFVPDYRKTGGKYITSIYTLKKINLHEKFILTANEKIIPFNNIICIEINNSVI